MSVKKNIFGAIKITSKPITKYDNVFKKIILFQVAIFVFSLILLWISDNQYVRSYAPLFVIFTPVSMPVVIWFWIFFRIISKIRIRIHNEELNFYIDQNYIIKLKSLSLIHLSNERCFLFYDRDGRKDYVLDLSRFTRDDIQIALNIFSKTVKITIDDDIAQKEKFVVKPQDITPVQQRPISSTTDDAPISSGRRRVVTNETSKRNQEMPDAENKNSPSKIRRRLEI